MLIKFLSLLAVSSTVALAQIHTNPGGGGLIGPPTPEELCRTLTNLTETDEKKFVKNHKKKYSSENDFFKLLEKMSVQESIQTLDHPKRLGSIEQLECDTEDITLLKTILQEYQQGGHVFYQCKEFKNRVEHYDLLKKVIEIHDKK